MRFADWLAKRVELRLQRRWDSPELHDWPVDKPRAGSKVTKKDASRAMRALRKEQRKRQKSSTRDIGQTDHWSRYG